MSNSLTGSEVPERKTLDEREEDDEKSEEEHDDDFIRNCFGDFRKSLVFHDPQEVNKTVKNCCDGNKDDDNDSIHVEDILNHDHSKIVSVHAQLP